MKTNYLLIFVPFGFSIFSLIRFAIFQHNLFNYLRENYTEKWKEITTIFGFGPGYANSKRTKEFLFGKCDYNDPELIRLKVTCRNSYIGLKVGFIVSFLTVFGVLIFNA